jgi:hypothetical protein
MLIYCDLSEKNGFGNSSPVYCSQLYIIFESFLTFNKKDTMGYSSLEWMVAVWLEPCRVESGRLSTSCSFFRRPTKKKVKTTTQLWRLYAYCYYSYWDTGFFTYIHSSLRLIQVTDRIATT